MTPAEQLDRRFAELNSLAKASARPPRGWIRAIRDGLGMTAAQLAKRIGVTQPRITEMERGEVSGNITLHSLERAAEAMGCRVVYALVPSRSLADAIRQRAEVMADRKLAAVEQTMRLEDQGVNDKAHRRQARQHMVDELLRRPARLWDEP